MPATPATPATPAKTETTQKPTLGSKKAKKPAEAAKKPAEAAKKLPEATLEEAIPATTPATPLRWKPVPTRAVQSLAEIQQEQVATGPA